MSVEVGTVTNTPVRVPKMAELVAAQLRRKIVRGELTEGRRCRPRRR